MNLKPEDVGKWLEEIQILPTTARIEKIAGAQLIVMASLLDELSQLRQQINDNMLCEPISVNVCNTVYTSSAP